MKIGDLVLVRYHNREEHLGIVVAVDEQLPGGCGVKVAWDDGDISWIAKGNVELL